MAEYTTTQARIRLRDLRTRLEFIGGMKAVGAWDEGPLRRAVNELTLKIAKKPNELVGSAKLYRCIDDIETARSALADIVKELRGATEWKPGD
jgi:hypothetical protein